MIGWLTSKVIAYALGAVLIGIVSAALVDGISNRATIRELTTQRDGLQGQLKTANTSLGTCQANYRGIELALDRQGADIHDLSEKSATATANAEKALAAIAKDGKAAREASQRVLALPRPAADQACEAAARLLRGPL